MDSAGTVTHWLDALQRGDGAAAQRLWEAYFRRLIGLAHRNLGGVPRGPSDSEDVVLSAFDSFYRGVAGGRFPQLADRDDLWRVLVTLTVRKASNAARKEAAAKRGGGQAAGGCRRATSTWRTIGCRNDTSSSSGTTNSGPSCSSTTTRRTGCR